jgi:formate dehydrogenase subunit delta
MEIEKLVKMANEISSFFEADPDPATRLEGLTAHLSRFWEPRMRRQLLAWSDETGGKELHPLVLEAIKKNRERLTPKAPIKTR